MAKVSIPKAKPRAVKKSSSQAVKKTNVKVAKRTPPKQVKKLSLKAVKDAKAKAAKRGNAKPAKKTNANASKTKSSLPLKKTSSKAVKDAKAKAAKSSNAKPAKKTNAKALNTTSPKVVKKTNSKADGLPEAVVVNLARRRDRWNSLKQRLTKLGAFAFKRVSATDGAVADIPESDVTLTWSTARNWEYVCRRFEGGKDCGYRAVTVKLTHGERGCSASHLEIWRQLASDHSRKSPLLVLEDDAVPTKHFVERYEQALKDVRNEAPDILYLGYSKGAPWRRTVSEFVREAEYVWTTVAYLLWPTGARKLLAGLPIDQPVDNYMANLIATRKLRAFVVSPPIVKQAGAWGVDNDIPHSDDVAWIQNCKE